jgi:SAM-dependent methyltransferase
MTSSAAAGYASRVNEYLAGRPEYPEEMLADLPPADIAVDLGAGTGKFTRLLAQRRSHVIAVEPIETMAARIPVDRLPGVEVLIGRAEAMPLAERQVGLVCCATAFHWFDFDQAMTEIARVLEQRGALALIWNVRDDRASWVASLSKLLDNYAGDTPRQSTGKWRAIFDDVRFRHLTSKSYPFMQPTRPSGIVDRVMSTSFIAALSHQEQQSVGEEVVRIIETDPGLAGTCDIRFPYLTELHVFEKQC